MIRSMTKSMLPVVLLAPVLAGCGVTGSWSSVSLEPEIARDEFGMIGPAPLGKEFTRARVTLRDDGTYSADVYYGQHLRQSAGRWEKRPDGLTFVSDEGDSATYRTKLSSNHKKLWLIRRIEGTDVKLGLRRE